MSKALVILSGGQDSITCLGVALKNHDKVETISFNYDQRHAAELNAAELVAAKKGVPWVCIDLPFFKELVTSALLDHDMDISAQHGYKPGLPASFVPNRNAVFLTLAHAYAQEIQADTIYTGVCQTDYSGYPDCREIFIKNMEETLNIGYETSIRIVTPLMFLTKAETFALAREVGILEDVLEYSITCYQGDTFHRHSWGFGCGECPACKLRAKGWEDFKKTM